MFSSRIFIVFCHVFNSIGHLEFIFVCGVRKCSNFIDLHVTFHLSWASLIAQLVRKSPEMQETLVQFLGWEDLLEKG